MESLPPSKPSHEYQQALEGLTTADPGQFLATVMRVLVARDNVAQEMIRTRRLLTEDFERVAQTDGRLRQAAVEIDRQVGRKTLSAWRNSRRPDASAWWWFLDEIASGAEPQRSPVWTLLAVLFLTVSLSLTTEISRRFLSGGVDEVSVLSTLVQALLAMFAGSTFTQAGERWLERQLDRRGIARRAHPLLKVGIAVAVLGSIVLLRLCLPGIARWYNDRGNRLHDKKEVAAALRSYQHAVKLSPGYAQAHYDLGAAYEDVLQYEKAIAEYQVAIEANTKFYAAYNNLAKLYILHRQDYRSALELIEQGLELQPEEVDVQYTLYKNRGWANLGLQNYHRAEEDLRLALEMRPKWATPHCLLAQVFEAKEEKEEALEQWKECSSLGDAPDQGDVEKVWLAIAQERQLQQEHK